MPEIRIVRDRISEEELRELAKDLYVSMIKGVVDVDQEIIAVGGEYHIDASNILTTEGSEQESVWGFNWYFNREKDPIEYVSLINIRPAQDNLSMEVEDRSLRDKIRAIITKRIQ